MSDAASLGGPETDGDRDASIRLATADEWPDALRLLYAHQPTALIDDFVRELIDAHHSGSFPLDRMVVAVCGDQVTNSDEGTGGGEICGAGLVSMIPGGAALFWPPVVRRESTKREAARSTDELSGAILRVMLSGIDDSEAAFGQCLLEPGLPESRLLAAGGVERICELTFYRSPLPLACTPKADDQLRFEMLETIEDWPPMVGGLIEQTYEGSVDCPEFSSLRQAADALAGYTSMPQFRADLSFVGFDTSGKAVGLALVAVHTDRNELELLYTGATPVARGRGLGRQLVTHAAVQGRAAGCRSMFLAVDGRNSFAIRAYAALGFQPAERREVWLYVPKRS